MNPYSIFRNNTLFVFSIALEHFLFGLIKLFWISEKCTSAIQLELNDVLFRITVKKIIYSCFIENNCCVCFDKIVLDK